MGALAGEGEVSGFEDEAEVALQLGAQRIEDGARHLDDPAAGLADEVLVGVLGEVIHRRTVAEMDVVDDAELLEVVEKAIHRRLVDVRMSGVHR